MVEKALAKAKGAGLAQVDTSTALANEVERQSGIAMIDGVDKQFRYRYPRLGKIRLGSPKPDRGPGKELPYFRLPDELLADEKFIDVLKNIGNEDPTKPTRIPIWLPFPSIAANLTRSCDSWNTSGLLKCRSYDGSTCQRLDEKTGEYVAGECPGDCNLRAKGYCRWVHRLIVILPDAKGSGVWQIDTPSPNNWATLLTEMAQLFGQTRGHISGIDLLLTREPRPFRSVEKNPDGSVKPDKNGNAVIHNKDHFMLHIKSEMTPRELLDAADHAVIIKADEAEGFDEGHDTERDFEHPEAPEVTEDNAEDAEFEVGDPTPEEVLRNTIREKMTELGFSEQQKINRVRAALKKDGTLEDMANDQLTAFYDALCEV